MFKIEINLYIKLLKSCIMTTCVSLLSESIILVISLNSTVKITGNPRKKSFVSCERWNIVTYLTSSYVWCFKKTIKTSFMSSVNYGRSWTLFDAFDLKLKALPSRHCWWRL